jgi:hypothetical protein
VTAAGGGSGKPPPDWRDDPMHRPAPSAGWDDQRPTAQSLPTVPAPADPTAAPSSSPPRGLSFPAYSPPRAADATSPTPSPSVDARPAGSTSAAPLGAAATSSSAAPRPPPAPRGDDPALPDGPDKYDENELRAAVGASPLSTSGKPRLASSREDEDDHGDQPRRRTPRAVLFAALVLAAVLGGAALVVVGYLNSERYVLACEAERAVPEQGRAFPPWGTRALGGAPWRPLKIAPETRCQPQETDDPLVLERAFLAMVLDQATALLTAREVTRVDEAEALLEQGLLLTRPPEHEPEPLARQRTEHHQEIERMLGDVAYWRATAKLREAASALGAAAAKFDAAVAQHPRHVSDADAWAAYARKLAQELHAGPEGTPPPAVSSAVPAGAPTLAAPPPAPPAGPTGASEHAAAPAGVALPVEPDPASGSPPAPAAPPPGSGAPTGGVLL